MSFDMRARAGRGARRRAPRRSATATAHVVACRFVPSDGARAFVRADRYDLVMGGLMIQKTLS
jgi:hypothetical protein